MEKDEKQEALEALLGDDPRRFCAAWLEAIEQQSDEEKNWRTEKAAEALKAYKGAEGSSSRAFNLFHSNIETLVPALYNSSPIPDIRRRFNDEDPVAIGLSELLERAIGFTIDDYDFDDVMKGVVKDMATVDRGIAWVKYEPTIENGAVVYEEATCELVEWDQFRRGPAKTWRKVPWIARAHFLDRKEVNKLLVHKANVLGYDQQTLDAINGQLRYAYSPNSTGDQAKDGAQETPKFGRREMVWEIWDKDTKQVIWLSQDYSDHPLALMEDPLRLKEFFPTPRPAQIITSTDTLIPITSYEIYSELLRQLGDVSERIDALVDQIRVRGGYAEAVAEMKAICEADDGELVALNNTEAFTTAGGDLSKAILWWPLEMIYKALEVLVQQREVIKQTIYEVTGLADIIRGATDPNETATAQGIKEKWGNIRVQSHQKEVERYARDLFRLKAEIMCGHFDIQTLLRTTGLKYPTQEDKSRAEQQKQIGEQMLAQYQQQAQAAQQAGQQPPEPPIPEDEAKQMQQQIEEILSKPALEEIEQLMRNQRVVAYRVDVESDSTVRADLTKNQEQMKGFLDGSAAYFQAMAPAVQEGVMDMETGVVIYGAFARNYRLGKTAEDAIEKWLDRVKKQGVQGKPPDPTVQATAEKLQAEAEKTRTETQLLPQQHLLEVASKRAEIVGQTIDRENARSAQEADFNLRRTDASVQRQDREADRGLKTRELDARAAQDKAILEESRNARQDNNKLERIKLNDARGARSEGYAMTAQSQATEFGPDGQPIARPPIVPPEMRPLEEGMTSEEQARMEKTDAILQQVAQGLQAIAQMQAQSQAQMAEAIQGLTQAIMAPKQVIRDGSGRAVGVAPQE